MQDVITWTSAVFKVTPHEVQVSVKQAIVDDVHQEILHLLRAQVVYEDRLRSLLGKIVCVASLVPTWGPLLPTDWPPLDAERSHKEPGLMGEDA